MARTGAIRILFVCEFKMNVEQKSRYVEYFTCFLSLEFKRLVRVLSKLKILSCVSKLVGHDNPFPEIPKSSSRTFDSLGKLDHLSFFTKNLLY